MGQSKIAVFRALLGDEERAQAANRAFEDAYGALIGEIDLAPIPGAAETISSLRDAGVRVALTTPSASTGKLQPKIDKGELLIANGDIQLNMESFTSKGS
ncbi:hypothetical protein APR08_000468 [Nocardia amikacinitolerans]|nr:hypothetical protein [Nocardia amikacinitolerans]